MKTYAETYAEAQEESKAFAKALSQVYADAEANDCQAKEIFRKNRRMVLIDKRKMERTISPQRQIRVIPSLICLFLLSFSSYFLTLNYSKKIPNLIKSEEMLIH